MRGICGICTPTPDDIPCGQGGGCGDVARSAYSQFPPGVGPPVAAFGTIGYLLICGLSFYRTINEGVRLDRTLLLGIIVVAALGTLFSLYLTAMEAFVIHHWCKWCVGSQALIALLTILGIIEYRQKYPKSFSKT